jgi:hypothetical protein
VDLFESWTTLDDEQRSARPSTSRTDEQRAETKAMIKKQKDYISEFTLRVGFVYRSKFSIVEVDLNYHEVCVIWVHDRWWRNTSRRVYGNWKISNRDRAKM